MLSMSHLTPLRLFRQGSDTYDIARILGCSEATAERLVHQERDLEWLHSRGLYTRALHLVEDRG